MTLLAETLGVGLVLISALEERLALLENVADALDDLVELDDVVTVVVGLAVTLALEYALDDCDTVTEGFPLLVISELRERNALADALLDVLELREKLDEALDDRSSVCERSALGDGLVDCSIDSETAAVPERTTVELSVVDVSIDTETTVEKVPEAVRLLTVDLVALAAALDDVLALSQLLAETLRLGSALLDERADSLTLGVLLCCSVAVPLVLALVVSPLAVGSSLTEANNKLGVGGASDGVGVDEGVFLVVAVAPPRVKLLRAEKVAAADSLALELGDLLTLELRVSLELLDALLREL